MEKQLEHLITFNDELCCTCLNFMNDAKLRSRNNRLEFCMLGKKQKKVIDVDIFICDMCIKSYKVKRMNSEDLIKKLINKIHPMIKAKLMKECGIPIDKHYKEEDSDYEWNNFEFNPDN